MDGIMMVSSLQMKNKTTLAVFSHSTIFIYARILQHQIYTVFTEFLSFRTNLETIGKINQKKIQ